MERISSRFDEPFFKRVVSEDQAAAARAVLARIPDDAGFDAAIVEPRYAQHVQVASGDLVPHGYDGSVLFLFRRAERVAGFVTDDVIGLAYGDPGLLADEVAWAQVVLEVPEHAAAA